MSVADCNGDGIINADDTLAIVTNFGNIHAKTDGYNPSWRSGIPSFNVKMSLDTALNNDTLTVRLILGDTIHPVSNIYGLAYTYHYDPLVVDTHTVSFSYIPSWLGNNTNSINLVNNNSTTGMIKTAITGINHTSRSGNGQIATFICVITTGNINGKNLSYYTNRNYISDITAIDQYGNPVPLNAGIDSNQIGYIPNGISDINKTTVIKIYPNPAHDQVIVSADAAITEISITDMLGKEVQTESINNKRTETIGLSRIDAGVYTIHVSTVSGTATAKLIVNR